MNPSSEQVKSAIRTLVASLGGALAGWAIGKGWISQDQAAAILSNQELIGAATAIVIALLGSGASAVAGIWGLVANKKTNLVATVAAMPEVAKVEAMPTPEGVALAAAVPPAPGVVVTVAPVSKLGPEYSGAIQGR